MTLKADSKKHRIFVYGTLRVGQPFHHLLGVAPVETTTTPPIYELLNLGRYPGLVEHGQTPIVGEVYEVDRETLEQLDEYEEHPVEYIRTQIKLSDGSLAETYIFQANAKNYPKILSGDWVNRPRPQPELYKSLDEMLDEHKN